MNKIAAIAGIAGLAIASTANAQLFIDVVGQPGSGFTTWTFSGSGIAALDGEIRTNADNTFSAFDTGQFPFGQDTILDTSIQDQVFALTGNASITVGGTTEPITGIFLDDDGGSADDLGIRAANLLPYLTDDASSWSGSGTVNVDLNAFALDTWSLNGNDGQAIFIADETIITFRIPAPGAAGLLGVAGLAATRRRR